MFAMVNLFCETQSGYKSNGDYNGGTFYRTVRQHGVYLAFSMHQLKSNLKSGANGRVESQHTHTHTVIHKPRVNSSHDDKYKRRWWLGEKWWLMSFFVYRIIRARVSVHSP